MKKSVLTLLVSCMVGAGIGLWASCQKESVELMDETVQIEVPTSTVGTSIYVIKKGGGSIGVNEINNIQTGVELDKVNAICQAATNVSTREEEAIVTVTGTQCGIGADWTSGGGSVIAVKVRGVLYKDGNSGYGLWTAAMNGIVMEDSLISGGIQANDTIPISIETYCNVDTTGAVEGTNKFTTNTTLIVSSGFICNSVPIIQVNGKTYKVIKKKK